MTAASSVDAGSLKVEAVSMSCYSTCLTVITMGIGEPDAPQLRKPEKRKRRVHAFRCHDGSLCTQKQPKTAQSAKCP